MAVFEPGWLMRTCHAAHIAVMCDNHPATLKHLGIKPEADEADEADAVELADKMAARFEAWTGRSLSDFIHR